VKKKLKQLGSGVLAILTLSLATAVGSIFVRRLGLSDFVTVTLSAVVGVVILFVVVGAVMSLLRRSQLHNISDMHDKLTNTLNEIANGNFNAFIELDEHAPHNDIAEAMNEMTRKLGTLEAMRADFVGNVSHEIQSPLTSIGGFARLLRESATDERSRHYADVIVAESNRLSGLSDNLLKLSTLDNNKIPLRRTDFRLDKQLRQVALTLEPQWSAKNLDLTCELEPTTINGDEELLSQAWINLLNNAIKFTPEGGSIQLSIDNGQLTIADTGVGISDEDRLHIFERFYKVDRARDRSLGGSGLGLSIVKKILDLHGFPIAVDSEIGVGTRFTIRLH
jgi:signal transduction histidine kinase